MLFPQGQHQNIEVNMCPKTVSRGRRVTLRTRWNRARARFFAFQRDHERRPHDSNLVKEHLAAAERWLVKGRRDEGLTEAVMIRLEDELGHLWMMDDWETRYRVLRHQLSVTPGSAEAFDSLIAAGCYADLIVAGLMEVGRPVFPGASEEVRQQARRQVQQLAEGLSVLADVNAAAAQGWSVELFPALDPGLTTILHDEVHRLNEWVNAFDLRHQPGDRPHRLTLFLAAARHAKDVTGIYRDSEFARIFDGLGVTTHGALVSEGTIRNWRQRERDADCYDPRRPPVDHMREAWG